MQKYTSSKTLCYEPKNNSRMVLRGLIASHALGEIKRLFSGVWNFIQDYDAKIIQCKNQVWKVSKEKANRPSLRHPVRKGNEGLLKRGRRLFREKRKGSHCSMAELCRHFWSNVTEIFNKQATLLRLMSWKEIAFRNVLKKKIWLVTADKIRREFSLPMQPPH